MNGEPVDDGEDFRFGVILLAAGRSRRMGRPKLLLPWGTTSILGHLLTQWRGAGSTQTVVVRAVDDELIRTELERLKFSAENCIFNHDPERGMFSSILCAAQWAGWEPSLTHWVIVLGDQPQLRQQSLTTLLNFSKKNPGKICQPGFNQRPSHPVVLPKEAYFELGKSEATTLKTFLSDRHVVICPIEDPGLELDIDRPEDYARALHLAGLAP